MKARIAELTGIEHPIIQADMTYAAYPPPVAAVCVTRGMGILGTQAMRVDEMREGFYFPGYRSAGWMSATGRMCLCQWLGINLSFRQPQPE